MNDQFGPGKRLFSLLGLIAVATMTGCGDAAAQVVNPEEQVAMALVAAPDDKKDGAKVLGYASDGTVQTIREGSNDFTCLSDKPGDENFTPSCFHNSLEPYFARGRELDAAGTPREQRYQIRWDEMSDGTLPMPVHSATQYLYRGTWDAATQTAEGLTRWVIYVPNATPETTGLTDQPIEGGPWIMFSGTPGAHIMIVPPGF